MIWVDREVKKIKERNFPREWVDDMKTPSGRIHVGALRGVVIHDLVYKVLVENNLNAHFSYVFNDIDPMDAIPSYLDYDKWEQYAGMPLYKIPAPEDTEKNFAQYYAHEFQQVFESINCHPEIYWSSEIYGAGKMDEIIKVILSNANKVREIYLRVSKVTKPNDWFPYQPVCENCGKVGTTQVTEWDGEYVYYTCKPLMVAWAKGCNHTGKVKPKGLNGKLHWRLDWPATWKILGVSVEGAGKDHMSSGGSYDFASAICKEILDYTPPFPVPYEWFTTGGRKMSSSKGVGSSAKEVAQILPPEVLRFLIVRTPIGTALDFDPFGDTIPNLFDDYDRCFNAYFDKLEKNIPEGKTGEVILDFARILELSQVRPLPEKRIFLPRFRTITNLIKTKTDITNFFEQQKGSPLNNQEKRLLEERIQYSEVYLKSYATEEEKVEFITKVSENLTISSEQKLFLQSLITELNNLKTKDREHIQEVIFTALKNNNLKPRNVFSAFYQLLIGKDFGPKAADLILEFGIDKVTNRLREGLS